jgi:3-oxoacyl-[acyl-carrier protein] reductase
MSEYKQLSRSVKGLTVLVTGAASGMGRATARVFAAEGANVAVTDLSADGTGAVADEITASGGKAKAWALDVADRDAIDRGRQRGRRAFRRPRHHRQQCRHLGARRPRRSRL